jgi:hypothetical protein
MPCASRKTELNRFPAALASRQAVANRRFAEVARRPT